MSELEEMANMLALRDMANAHSREASDLDIMVMEVALKNIAEVNNRGIESQLLFLLKSGIHPQEILEELAIYEKFDLLTIAQKYGTLKGKEMMLECL